MFLDNKLNSLEKRVWSWILTGFAMVVLAQAAIATGKWQPALLSQTGARTAAPNQAVGVSATPLASKITIRLVNGQHLEAPASVQINGAIIGTFSGCSCTVVVGNHDQVTIDTSASPGIYEFIVDFNDPNVVSPIANSQYESSPLHPATVGPCLLSIPSE